MDSHAEKKATIVEVAKLAKVSTITVSRAFSTPELVKESTRQLIYKSAEELNYIPNAFARTLKTNSSKIIGVVTDSTYNQVYAQAVTTLCAEADKLGYGLMMFETMGSEEKESNALDTLFSYKVAGIVLSVVNDSKTYDPRYIRIARKNNIPLVLLDRDIKTHHLPGVFLNNHEIGVKSGNYLAHCGAQRLLIIGGPEQSEITQERVNGILSTQHNPNLQTKVIYAHYNYQQTRELLLHEVPKLSAPPTHVVGINGQISLAAIGVFRTLGYKDVQFFSIDPVPYAADFGFSIPCIDSDPVEWGLKISSLLFKLIEHNNDPAYFDRLFIYGKLITH